MLKRWQQVLLLAGFMTLFGVFWVWSSPSSPVHACDDEFTIFNECDLEFEFTIRAIERINVYRYQETEDGLELCYRTVWVYINDRQSLLDNRATNAPVYPTYGSVGLFTQEAYEQLLNDGVIELAPVLVAIFDSGEQCVAWGEGHIQDEGPPTLPEWEIEPLDPIDPPLWKEVELEEPIEGISKLFAYGYETEAGFYELVYVHPFD